MRAGILVLEEATVVRRSELKALKLAAPLKGESKAKCGLAVRGVSRADFGLTFQLVFLIVTSRLQDYLGARMTLHFAFMCCKTSSA